MENKNNNIMDIVKPGLVLLIVTVVAACVLSFVNGATKEPIEQKALESKNEAMKIVLEEASSFEDVDFQALEGEMVKGYSVGHDENENIVGYVVTAVSKGYGGDIEIVVGLNIEGEITGVNVVKHGETPGLGANAENPSFTDQFKGKNKELNVVKTEAIADDEVQAITAATITSRAVTDGVSAAISFYEENLKEG